MPKTFPQLLGVIGGALLGAVVAQGVAPRGAHACSCPHHQWVYNRVSTEAPDGAPDHTPYWGSQVSVQANEGFIFIQAGGQDEPEAMSRVVGVSR